MSDILIFNRALKRSAFEYLKNAKKVSYTTLLGNISVTGSSLSLLNLQFHIIT